MPGGDASPPETLVRVADEKWRIVGRIVFFSIFFFLSAGVEIGDSDCLDALEAAGTDVD